MNERIGKKIILKLIPSYVVYHVLFKWKFCYQIVFEFDYFIEIVLNTLTP